MGDVVRWNGITKLDLPVADVLARAAEAKLTSAIVIGEDDNGRFFASSAADGAEVLWALEMAKRDLLAIGSGDEE